MPSNSCGTVHGVHRWTVSGSRAAAAGMTAGAAVAKADILRGSSPHTQREGKKTGAMEEERARREGERDIEEERAVEAVRDPADMQTRGRRNMRENGRHSTRSREAHEALNCHRKVQVCLDRTEYNTIRCSLCTHNPLFTLGNVRFQNQTLQVTPVTGSTRHVSAFLGTGNLSKWNSTGDDSEDAERGTSRFWSKRERLRGLCAVPFGWFVNMWRSVFGHLDELVSSV